MHLIRARHTVVGPGNRFGVAFWVILVTFHIKIAVHQILATYQYAYLLELFSDRKNLFRTRMFYALAARESHELISAHRACQAAGARE